MMPRLIDADTIFNGELLVVNTEAYDAVRAIIEKINNAPTVDAISIEWILNNERMPKDGKGHDAIMDMIEEWRKERGCI